MINTNWLGSTNANRVRSNRNQTGDVTNPVTKVRALHFPLLRRVFVSSCEANAMDRTRRREGAKIDGFYTERWSKTVWLEETTVAWAG
jgi:hypothetical protein